MTQWKYETTGDEVVAAFRKKVKARTSMLIIPFLKFGIDIL
jgi:hypothetical protein